MIFQDYLHDISAALIQEKISKSTAYQWMEKIDWTKCPDDAFSGSLMLELLAGRSDSLIAYAFYEHPLVLRFIASIVGSKCALQILDAYASADLTKVNDTTNIILSKTNLPKATQASYIEDNTLTNSETNTTPRVVNYVNNNITDVAKTIVQTWRPYESQY